MLSEIDKLNPSQKEAVLHQNGPMMIIAGAGSGKTRVLTMRIAHLIANGVDPYAILALTFTNKAAGEMRKRIESMIGTSARNLWMGTFHSVFAKILRVEGVKLGYSSDFSIYDTDDSKSLLRAIIKEFNLDDKTYKVNYILNRISGAKNALTSWESYLANSEYQMDDRAARMPEIGRIYQTYAQRCFHANAMDFDDLLFNTNVLFRDHIDVLNKYQHKFKHVMVDEFQDTNISQYLITRKLSAVNQNICIVGDDAQSIYAFRGANIQNILNFTKDFDDVKIVKLEQNYRSTKNIVEAANSIISKNRDQLDKKVFTANDEGPKIPVLKTQSDTEEGRLIATEIFEEKNRNKFLNKDFAILYRTNAQSRAFEENLRRMNIKYRIVGGLSFYQRKEIKDVLAYLRYTINQNDEEAFKRIINTPKRGIGDTTIAKITVTASEQNVSIWDVVSNIDYYAAGRSSLPVQNFATLIKSFKILVEDGKDAYTVVDQIAKASGLLRELHQDKTVEGMSRYENVQELLNAVKQFVDDEEIEDKSISSFLQSVSLLTSADDGDDGDDDRVTMMTIHGAKGLEFKNVFVVGLEENLFPSQMMLQSRADLEEERRLFYVAITRAELKLTLSYAETRYVYGRLNPCEPSRFLSEIDEQYLQLPSTTKPRGFAPKTLPSAAKPTPLGKPSFSPKPVAPSAIHKVSDNFIASTPAALKEGQRVEHPKFGFGKITKLDFGGTDKKATVVFESQGEKTLLLNFAKLMVVE